MHKKLKIQECENKQKKKRCLDIKTKAAPKVVVHLGIIFQKNNPRWYLAGYYMHVVSPHTMRKSSRVAQIMYCPLKLKN